MPAGAGNPDELTAVIPAALPASAPGGIAIDCGDALGCTSMESGNITTAEGFRTAYAEIFSDVGALAAGLDDERSMLPTGCPGWTVRDHVAHVIDLESILLGRPRAEHTVPEVLPY